MQLQKEQIKSVSRGIEGRWNYQVANSPKVMSMFYDKLYSDKILAPIRELTTNAIDAHVEAGTLDKPIKYKLPSIYDETPTFSIRDYGTGMSNEKIIKLYRILGLSDKEDSDEMQGCYGTGSKSPLAYCDSFTTTSYFNGTKSVYVNAKLANGVPQLQKVGEYPTNEPNGVEISFPIKVGDVNSFKEKLAKVLKRCPIPFESNISIDIKKDDREILIEGENWKVYKGNGNSCAVMGYIEYPIDKYQFSSTNQSLLNIPIELYFNIGEIEMDISRERLQYNKLTLDAINSKLNNINTALLQMIKEKIESASCLYDARNLVVEFKGKFDWVVKSTSFTWKNQRILLYSDITEKIRLDNDFIYSEYLYKYNGYTTKIKHKLINNFYNLMYNERLAIVIDNIGKSARGRTSYYLKSLNCKFSHALIINEKNKQKIIDILGIPQERLIYTSDLPKVPKAPRLSTAKTYSAKVYTIGDTYDTTCNISRNLRNKYYVICHRDKFNISLDENQKKTYTWNSFKQIKLICELAKINNINLPSEIYFIVPSKLKTVKRWGWTNLIVYLDSQCKSLIKKTNFEKVVIGKEYDKVSSFYIPYTYSQNYKKLNHGLFKKYCRIVDIIKEYNNNKVAKLTQLCGILDINFNQTNTKSYININKLENEIIKKYPLLNLLIKKCYGVNNEQQDIDEIIHYINLVDSKI